MLRKIACIFVMVFLSGCADEFIRNRLIRDVQNRSGFIMPAKTEVGKITLPPATSLEDGITEDEAVMIALWNNAAFQETLINLDIAHGDLVQAGLLPNPIGFNSFSATNKPFKYFFEFPIEALWLRPFLIKAAKAEQDRVAHQLSQAGLNLISDTRKAYSDMLQAQAQFTIFEESMALRQDIADLTQKRLKAGDISLQEVTIAHLDALAAQQDVARIKYDKQISEERLRFMMGIGSNVRIVTLDNLPAPDCAEMDVATLVTEAITNRPDALAAKQATKAAEARTNLSLFNMLGLAGIADATSGAKTGHQLSPAVRSTIPIFNQNQGAISSANAQEARALRGEDTITHQIRLDVNQAYTQYQQACAQLHLVQTNIKTGVKTNMNRAQKAYDTGDISYLTLLESTRALIDARLREAQLVGDAHRAFFELERSVGRKLRPLSKEPKR